MQNTLRCSRFRGTDSLLSLAVDARRPSNCSFYTVPERGDQQEVIMKLEFECEATLNFTLRHVFHTIPKFLNFSLSVK